MGDFTDFKVKLNNGEEVDFRHSAQTVQEFLEIEAEFIYDVFGTQVISKSDICLVRLDPRPYVAGFHMAFGRPHDSLTTLWTWVNSLDKPTRDRMKAKHYQVVKACTNYYE